MLLRVTQRSRTTQGSPSEQLSPTEAPSKMVFITRNTNLRSLHSHATNILNISYFIYIRWRDVG